MCEGDSAHRQEKAIHGMCNVGRCVCICVDGWVYYVNMTQNNKEGHGFDLWMCVLGEFSHACSSVASGVSIYSSAWCVCVWVALYIHTFVYIV